MSNKIRPDIRQLAWQLLDRFLPEGAFSLHQMLGWGVQKSSVELCLPKLTSIVKCLNSTVKPQELQSLLLAQALSGSKVHAISGPGLIPLISSVKEQDSI